MTNSEYDMVFSHHICDVLAVVADGYINNLDEE